MEMLRRMELIRAFEQRLSEANAAGEVPTEAIHLSIGQEATAVGACFALRADDNIATTHRGHGHMLAKGADLDGMLAEILAVSEDDANYHADWKNIRLIVVDQYSELGDSGCINAAGLLWVEGLIESASLAEHVVLVFHEPAFPRHGHVGGSFDACPDDRNAFWDMLEMGGMVFASYLFPPAAPIILGQQAAGRIES